MSALRRSSDANSPPRTVVVWCPDWSLTAAGVTSNVPAAVINSNRVVGCSAAARGEGVGRNLRRREAQARCPELLILDHDAARDARAFEPIVAALEQICPRIEILRPGRCAFLARGPARYFGGDERVAEGIISAVAAVGVSCRVGIADGRFAALLAARDRGLDGEPSLFPSTIVPSGRAATSAFLGSFSVQTLDSPELADLLLRLGIRTLGDLATIDPSVVSTRFGIAGADAARLARGEDERPLSARTPPEDLSVAAELDPPADRADRAAFVAKRLADSLHESLGRLGLACTRIGIEAETEHGEHLVRLWRHDGALTAGAIAERVRWQLDAWLATRDERDRPTSGITLVRLVPDEVRPDVGRQLGFWGGTTHNDERAARALARVQGMLGLDEVRTPVLQGGRSPAERVRLVPWGDARSDSERVEVSGLVVDDGAGAGAGDDADADADADELSASPSHTPWPGQVPHPAPAVVYADDVPADVRDAYGITVRVTGRGLCTGAPARLTIAGGSTEDVVSWAGPWLVDERWWDPPAHRRRARFQLVTASGAAHLAGVEGGRWWIEATYD